MEDLKNVLIKIIELLEHSEESLWSPLTPSEVVKILDNELQKLEKNEEFDKDLLELEFAPTSTIQEISMANDWSQEYIKLADEFDRAIRFK